MDDAKIKDSGARTQFETGAVRDIASGRGRMDLVPLLAVWMISRIYEDGAAKYAENNWMKGIPVRHFVKSALNHLAKYADGLRDEPHLSQAGWNILGAIWTACMVQRGVFPKEFGLITYDVPVLSSHEIKSLEIYLAGAKHPYEAGKDKLYVGKLPEER
jgi:hypothetical protein